MTPEYLDAVSDSLDSIKKVIESISDEYLVIVTADHGGHNRAHGADIPEDMTIPIVFYNKDIKPAVIERANIADIAPTITDYMGVPGDDEWEGNTINLRG